jgi:prolyl-tRNA synthetase
VSKNAQLLIRAGFIHKEMAGVYSILPLGMRVIAKIKKIVGEEMEKIGSQEILMSTLQNKELWEKTGRWDDEKVDVWFKSELKNGVAIGFGWSHEEPITEMMKLHIKSYANLPIAVHQFQNKLRNEVRAKSGIMRCREFVMKDMYFFAPTEESNTAFYDKSIEAYTNVFKRIGLGDITYVTSASGGAFTNKFSHEFQTICDAGEDTIYINKSKHIAVNEEVFNKDTLDRLGMKEEDFEKVKAAEVGNIFNFGTEKCEEMGLEYTDINGTKKLVHLSSYGVGITRLLGVITEVYADDAGLSWPEAVAPFQIHLVSLANGNEEITKEAEDIYKELLASGAEVLFDDRDARAGEKFADSDLIGIPKRIIISEKSLAQGVVEVKDRASGKVTMVPLNELRDIV